MHLGQIRLDGATVAAIFEDGAARPIPSHTMCDLISRADAEMLPLSTSWPPAWPAGIKPQPRRSFPSSPRKSGLAAAPMKPARPSAMAEHGTREGMYAYVYKRAAPGDLFQRHAARLCRTRPEHRHSGRFEVHRARAGAGGHSRTRAARLSAIPLPTMFPPGISSARTRCTCRSRRCIRRAARLGPVMITEDSTRSLQSPDDLRDQARRPGHVFG